MPLVDIAAAFETIRSGGVVACPTEAVYGLSCDPWNEAAVRSLLAMKERDAAQGLILVAGGAYQFTSLLRGLPRDRQEILAASWPGPVTWLVPANEHVPPWIRGRHDKVALPLGGRERPSEIRDLLTGEILRPGS